MGAPIEKQVFYTIKIGDRLLDVTGRKRTPKGYVALYIKEHPYAGKDGYVMEHRIVMEMKLGRFLNSVEVVHHLNETKHDNRLNNLELMDHGEHTRLHHIEAKRSNKTRMLMSEMAKKRFKEKKNHPSYKKIDKEIFKSKLKKYGPTETSKLFGVSRKTIYNKIQEFELEGWYEN